MPVPEMVMAMAMPRPALKMVETGAIHTVEVKAPEMPNSAQAAHQCQMLSPMADIEAIAAEEIGADGIREARAQAIDQETGE